VRTIALANQKGGTGKTTTAVNLGAALGDAGRKVLLIDLDPQAHLSAHLGCEDAQVGSYELITRQARPDEVAIQLLPGVLDVIPAGLSLAAAEVELAGEVGRELFLRTGLQDLTGYDYVLVDCAPSLGLLTVNALAAVREVFIPVQLQWMALRGLGQLLQTIEAVNGRLNPELELTGVIGCMFQARRILCAEVLATLRQHFGKRVFKTVIRDNIRLAEAPGHALPIQAYDPRSRGAEDYKALAREVLARERRARAKAHDS
jgi:chromosome partitioning protein